MDDDRTPDIQTESILSSEDRRFWRIDIPTKIKYRTKPMMIQSHLQLCNLISTVHDDRIYLISGRRILCLHPSTGGYELLAVLCFRAPCIGAYGQWVVAGSNSVGTCYFVKVTKSDYRALPHRRRSAVARARRRARDWRKRGRNHSFAFEIPDAASAPAGPTDVFTLSNLDADPTAARNTTSSGVARAERPPERPTVEDLGALEPDSVAQLGGSTINSVHVGRLRARFRRYASEDIVIVGSDDRKMTVFSLTRWDVISVQFVPARVYCATLSPDNKTIVAVGDCPIVFFYSVEVAPRTPGASRLNGRLDGPKLHDWRFVLSAKIVLPLDPGIVDRDACSSTVSFNHSSSLLAIGAHDGSITILDVQAVQATYPKKEPPEERDLSPGMVIHSFKSTREPLEGGAVKHLAFSPPPWDLLVWIEDTDCFGVADMRATFRRRQIVHLNPSDSSLRKVPPYEVGITARDEQASGEEWGQAEQSGADLADHDGDGGSGDDNNNNDDDDDDDNHNSNNNGSGGNDGNVIRSVPDDDYSGDVSEDEPDENFGHGGECNCCSEPRRTVIYALYPEDEEEDEVFPANETWNQLSAAEPDPRRRRALFFDRAEPEDIADWGIEHWSRDTDRFVYLAREPHYQRYWRGIASRPGAAVMFWTTHSIRRSFGHFGDATLALHTDPEFLRLLEARPPPMETYINLRRSRQVCRHGITSDGMEIIWSWYDDPLRYRRQTPGASEISIDTVSWDRIPHAFDRTGHGRPYFMPDTDGPADDEGREDDEAAREQRRRWVLASALRHANPPPIRWATMERADMIASLMTPPGPVQSNEPPVLRSDTQEAHEGSRGGAQEQPGQEIVQPRSRHYERQRSSQHRFSRRTGSPRQQDEELEGIIGTGEINWSDYGTASPLSVPQSGPAYEDIDSGGWLTDPLPVGTPIIFHSGPQSLSPHNTNTNRGQSGSRGGSLQSGVSRSVTSRRLGQSTTHHLESIPHRHPPRTANRVDRRGQVTSRYQRPGRNRAGMAHSPAAELRITPQTWNEVGSIYSPFTLQPTSVQSDTTETERASSLRAFPSQFSVEPPDFLELDDVVLDHFTEDEFVQHFESLMDEEMTRTAGYGPGQAGGRHHVRRPAAQIDLPESIRTNRVLSGAGWTKTGIL
ncbi:hypothetical protein KEM54_000900 [Ascosphaera aggregata]|nr:hypothetical protein KEM54_000900 [Ascosphaera aggregata]